ncbi:MAG: CHAT domain-containing protein, partial [candidate division KSB1 bacterium]
MKPARTTLSFFASLIILTSQWASFSQTKNSNEQITLASPFPLTTHPEADLMPALSAEGKWLAYVSRQNGNYDIWVRATAGGLPSLLTTNTSEDYSPSWSPASKALVFVSRRDDAEGDLYLLPLEKREDGFAPGKIKRLTHNLEREAFPQFSPDGKKIAYSFGAKGQEQIWLYEIKNGARYQLTTRGGTQPAWSPNGSELALACRTGETSEQQIFIISADTAQADYLRRQVTFEGDNHFPAWSRDGKSILVQRNESSANARASRLYIVPVDFSTTHFDQLAAGLQITPDSESALFPCWSRDGAIYYAAEHYGNLDLWRIPEAGPIPRFSSPAEAFAHAQKIVDHETAVLAFSALRYHFPDSTDWLALAGVEMGRRYVQMNELAQARKSWNNVVLYYIGANEGAGLAELELAKLDANVERFAVLRARYHAWPNVQALCALAQGLALQQQRQYDLALKTFQNLAQQFPQLREVCYRAALHAADLLLVLERSEAAEARYAGIIAEYRENAEWRGAAMARLLDVAPTLARTADTLAAYQRLIQRHAAQTEIVHNARFRIAARLQREGEAQLAENEWRNVIDALAALEDAALRSLRAQALRHLLELQIARNDLPVAELLYAQLEKEHGAPNETAIVQAARLALTQALLRRGRALLAARDFQLARAAFDHARRYDAREVEAHRGYIETLHALDQIEQAIAEYTQRSAQSPRDEIALYALGLAYSYQGAREAKTLRRSSAVIEAALALNYRLVPAYLTLGFNYEAIEKLELEARNRKQGFFEKIAFALPGFLDNLRRTLTFRPPKAAARWYERALEALTMAIALNDEAAHPQREAQLALNLANIYYNLGDFAVQNAYRYYQIKQRYDSTFVSSQQAAVVLEHMGETGWASGKYQEAAPRLREAVKEYHLLRDVEGELRSLLRLALLYQTSGDYNTSNDYFREFITASRRENREANVAQVWRTIARNHQLLAENDDAITRSLRSLHLLETGSRDDFPQPQKNKLTIKLLGLPIFWRTIAPTGEEASAERLTFEQERELVFSIIEESHATRKDFDEALIELEKKLASFRKRQDRKGEALALNNLGTLRYNLHDFTQAHAHYLRSFKICAQNNFAGGAIINLLNLGNLALLRARAGDESILSTLATIDSLVILAQPLLEQATARQQLAVFTLRGNLAYENAVRLWPEAEGKNGNAQPEAPAATDLQNELQRSLQAMQYFAHARWAYEQALARAQRLPREEIIVRRNLASLLMLAQDFAPAWAHLRFAHERSVENNFTQLTWRIEHALGALTQVAPEHSFSANTALDWYRHALGLLEALPEEPEGVEQRLGESEEQAALYENVITLLAALGDTAKQFQREALGWAERKQARHFINLIAGRYVLPRDETHRVLWGGGGGLASDELRQLSRLQGEYIKLQAEEPQRPKELARVREDLEATERRYQAIVQEALAEDPELASFFSVQGLDLQSVRDSLAAGAAVLKYFVAEKEILIWLLTRERFEQMRVPYERAQLRREIATLREAWRANNSTQRSRAQALSTLLLAPLQRLENCSQLILVPDDALHYLPFAALSYEGETLAQSYTLTRVASLQALQFAARHKNLNAEQLLLVQDAGAPAPRFLASLSNLKTQTLAGVDWRGENGLHPQVQSAGLLHVQSRLALQPERPLDSGFVLRFMKSESLMTARLPLYRLFENELRASVLVLENAALPYRAGQTGEELIALQRSLFYSGVPSLVMSQWEVAPEVRQTFYAQLYAGL